MKWKMPAGSSGPNIGPSVRTKLQWHGAKVHQSSKYWVHVFDDFNRHLVIYFKLTVPSAVIYS